MQLLAITDLERVDRGLAAGAGTVEPLNGLAQQGANASQDPPFPTPFDGTSARTNWADGNSALLAAYEWMYDDGPGSGNFDCTDRRASRLLGPPPHDPRHGYGRARSVMGAAFAATGSGGSMTEVIVGGDTTDHRRPDADVGRHRPAR